MEKQENKTSRIIKIIILILVLICLALILMHLRENFRDFFTKIPKKNSNNIKETGKLLKVIGG